MQSPISVRAARDEAVRQLKAAEEVREHSRSLAARVLEVRAEDAAKRQELHDRVLLARYDVR